MINRLCGYRLWDIEGRNIKKTTESAKKYRNPVFSRVDILVMVAQNPLMEFLKEHFLKELSKIFQMHLNILPKVWLILCCHSTKYKTWATIDILMTITPEVNMIIREMTPFLSFAFWALSVAIFHFCILKPSKFSSWDPCFALCFGL